jgi:hypothetical protein
MGDDESADSKHHDGRARQRAFHEAERQGHVLGGAQQAMMGAHVGHAALMLITWVDRYQCAIHIMKTNQFVITSTMIHLNRITSISCLVY